MNVPQLVERVRELYELQKNVVIVCGEGIRDQAGKDLGAQRQTQDPAGNVVLTGASEALRNLLIEHLGDAYFQAFRRAESAQAAVFTRKVGHTQRGGRPILFDRFHAVQLGGKAVDMLLEGQNNAVSTLQWSRAKGFYVDGIDANAFRDRWGVIHARYLHPACYDAERMQPSRIGVRLPAAHLHQRHRPRRRRGDAPADLRLGQPLPPVPLREHGREQADPVSGPGGLNPGRRAAR